VKDRRRELRRGGREGSWRENINCEG